MTAATVVVNRMRDILQVVHSALRFRATRQENFKVL
jgi:hypothetical protein